MAGKMSPLSDSLANGLRDERVRLLAQRDEAEAEYLETLARVEADLGTKIANIDVRLGHIDWLLGAEPVDPPREPKARVPHAPPAERPRDAS